MMGENRTIEVDEEIFKEIQEDAEVTEVVEKKTTKKQSTKKKETKVVVEEKQPEVIEEVKEVVEEVKVPVVEKQPEPVNVGDCVIVDYGVTTVEGKALSKVFYRTRLYVLRKTGLGRVEVGTTKKGNAIATFYEKDLIILK